MPYSPLAFHYRSNALNVVNDGRRIFVRYEPGSYLIAGGHRYELTDFHFHIPGEHRIKGPAADMELQLTHRDELGRIAIVAVPIRAGRRMNSTLSRIWDHLPGVGGESYYGRQVGVNALFLLPSEKSYFSYMGSLTEPPCTEGVQWFVLATPLEVDVSYLRRL
jgi:carbonic anhydrase